MKRILIMTLINFATLILRAAVVNGSCGTSLTWSLNTNDSTLVIEGSGTMTPNPSYLTYSSYIKHVSLPQGITHIGINAFYDCTNLVSVSIPSSVTTIDVYAFRGCEKLTSVNIPNNVTTLEQGAFYDCTGLLSITLPNNITTIASNLLSNCPKIKTIFIPNSVSQIKGSAFSQCSSLESIIIPGSVTSIGDYAFSNDTSLKTLTIPNSVSTIGRFTFNDCTGLTSLTCESVFPPTLGENAFKNVNKSIPLFVPAQSIGTYANTILWEEFANIVAIGTIIGTYRVEFRDWNNTLLKVDSVNYGNAATAPQEPYRPGYTFTGWDVDFGSVTSDLIITAQYELGEEVNFTINFMSQGSNDDLYTNNVVLKVPAAPEIEGFIFIGWQPVSEIIGNNTIKIEAIYEADEPTTALEVVISPTNPSQKLFRNGNVYILRDDKTYSIQGIEVH